MRPVPDGEHLPPAKQRRGERPDRVGSRFFDTGALASPPTSPWPLIVLAPLVLAPEYALFRGSEPLAVVGLVLVQLAALLIAPRELWRGVIDLEKRWMNSPWPDRQRRVGTTVRRGVGVVGRVSLIVSIAAPLLLGLALQTESPALDVVATAFVLWGIFVSPPALLFSGVLSGRLLPRRWRKVQSEPATLSRIVAGLYGDRHEARRLGWALVLFLGGTAAAVVATAPGTVPF